MLSTSPSGISISAGYDAWLMLFDLLDKGCSNHRPVLRNLLDFEFHGGEGLLAGAERLNRLVELSKTNVGSETGVSGATSSFFNDLLLIRGPTHTQSVGPR